MNARDITDQLIAARDGNPAALDQVFPRVYEELRRIAHNALARERSEHTLTTTALVHEAYLKLVVQERATWNDRAHFLAIAATAMRRILVDYARMHRRLKRGGDLHRVTLTDAVQTAGESAETLLALDDALTRLGDLNPRLSRIVDCRFFGGMTTEETAEALGVTTRTVERDWRKARGWLFDQLRDTSS
jgi:RNA polymerase sigma factor (TIGR02999 family)